MSKHLRVVAIGILILSAKSVDRAQAVTYSVTDLGTLGGPQSVAYDINSGGQVTGTATTPGGAAVYAFLWSDPGPMVSLGTLSGTYVSNGRAINDAAWVVGSSNGHGFLCTPSGGMQDLGTLPGGTLSSASGINNAGVVVGVSATVGDTYLHATIWDSSGGLRDLNRTIANPPVGWTPTCARVINDYGVIAGIGYPSISSYPPSGREHAFILDRGTLTEIPGLGGDIQPEGINASGEVVGFSHDSGGQPRAFVYTRDDGTRDIGTLGGLAALALGLNDNGEIVGVSQRSDGSAAAFLYSDAGGMVDLNTLALGSGWNLLNAYAINNNSQIAGYGYNPEGESHAFLMTPTPEPGTLILLAAAGLWLLVVHGCHRRGAEGRPNPFRTKGDES